MKKNIVLYFIFGLFFLLAGKSDVYAWDWKCCKVASDVSTSGVCGGGVSTCSISHHECCDSHDDAYCTSISECSDSTATPPSGYSTSCVSENCDSCVVTCTGCNNQKTFFKNKPIDTCKDSAKCAGLTACGTLNDNHWYCNCGGSNSDSDPNRICISECESGYINVNGQCRLQDVQCRPGDWIFVDCDTTATCSNSNEGTCDPADCTDVPKPPDKTQSELPAICCQKGTWSYSNCATTQDICSGGTCRISDCTGVPKLPPRNLPTGCDTLYYYCNSSSCLTVPRTGFTSVSDCKNNGGYGECYLNLNCDSKCGTTTSSYYYCNASGKCMGPTTNTDPSTTYYLTSNCDSQCKIPTTPPLNDDMNCGEDFVHCQGDDINTFFENNGVPYIAKRLYTDNQSLCKINPNSDLSWKQINIQDENTNYTCKQIDSWRTGNSSMRWGNGYPQCDIKECFHGYDSCIWKYDNPDTVVWSCSFFGSDKPLYCYDDSPTPKTDGVCNIAINGQFILPNVNPTNLVLCSAGTPSVPVLNATEWIWNCNGICGGNPTSCSAFINSPPVFKGITIKNNFGTTVNPETGSKNQICDPQFNGSRQVTFEVGASDPDGIDDIKSITLTWNGRTIPQIGSIRDITTFGFQEPFSSTMDESTTYPLVVTITDGVGSTATNNTRSFKVWNCQVPVSGTLFDGSDAPFGTITDCSAGSGQFDNNKKAPALVNFTSLTFKNGDVGKIMGVTSSSSTYSNQVGNELIWGNSYIPDFNTDFAGSDISMRVPHQTACQGSLTLDNTVVPPYDNNPSVVVDFSTIINQESWWQARGGGVMAKGAINDNVPITCDIADIKDGTCKAGVTSDNLEIGSSNNGIVAVGPIPVEYSNDSGCGDKCKFGIPNNWYTNNNLVQETYDYTYFYNKYHINLGQGVTVPIIGGNPATMTEINNIGATGVVFIKGNLDINVDNTVPIDNFLMVIVSGEIKIGIGASKVDGLFVGKSIKTIGDSSPDQLVINGSLYAWGGDVNLGRGFADKINNNTKPAVVVNYRPDFIFSMPGKLIKVLSGWKLGI